MYGILIITSSWQRLAICFIARSETLPALWARFVYKIYAILLIDLYLHQSNYEVRMAGADSIVTQYVV